MFKTLRFPTAFVFRRSPGARALSAALVALCGALAAPAALAGSDYPPGLFENSPVVGPGGQAPANPAAPQATPNPDRPNPDRPGPRALTTLNPDRRIPGALRRPTRPTPRRPMPRRSDLQRRWRRRPNFATASGCGPSAASRTSGGRTRSATIVSDPGPAIRAVPCYATPYPQCRKKFSHSLRVSVAQHATMATSKSDLVRACALRR